MRCEQKAIVLKTTDKGETSKLITFLTEKENIVQIVVHGFKSKKSELKALLQMGNLLTITTETNRHKTKIINSEIINYYPIIKSNIDKINYLSYCYKILIHLPFDLQNDLKNHFRLMEKIQTELEVSQPADYKLMELYYLYSLTYCFGIRPTDQDLDCSKIKSDQEYFFNNADGKITENKLSMLSLPVNYKIAVLFIKLHNSKLKEIIRQTSDQDTVEKVKNILLNYLKIHINYTFKLLY